MPLSLLTFSLVSTCDLLALGACLARPGAPPLPLQTRMPMLLAAAAAVAAAVHTTASGNPPTVCSRNGVPLPSGGCRCDAAWAGADCSELALLPAAGKTLGTIYPGRNTSANPAHSLRRSGRGSALSRVSSWLPRSRVV